MRFTIVSIMQRSERDIAPTLRAINAPSARPARESKAGRSLGITPMRRAM